MKTKITGIVFLTLACVIIAVSRNSDVTAVDSRSSKATIRSVDEDGIPTDYRPAVRRSNLKSRFSRGHDSERRPFIMISGQYVKMYPASDVIPSEDDGNPFEEE